MRWREANGIRWLEAGLPGATVAFSTRLGGVSEAPYDSLNLGMFTEDARDAALENRRRLAAALGFPPERVAVARQVHGAALAEHSTPLTSSFATQDGTGGEGQGPVREADGHVVTERGLAAAVFVADCVPVALAGAEGAAVLHCGWRGLASSGCGRRRVPAHLSTPGLIERGIGAVGATDAVIGPAIGPCCYEVGDDVLDAFAELGSGIASGRMLDLPEIARRLLHRAGVERVETSGLCTSCEPELFFSHRRDAGRTGRQAGLVWRTEGGA